MIIREKFIESLELSSKAMQTADHMVYITFPLIKEKRLLLKVLSEISSSLIHLINAALQYEYYYKRIELYKDARENFNTFKRIAHRYELTDEQVRRIIEILNLAEKHKKSPFEFVKDDRIVIMSDGMRTDTLTLEKTKSFLIESKEVIKKVSSRIRSTGNQI